MQQSYEPPDYKQQIRLPKNLFPVNLKRDIWPGLQNYKIPASPGLKKAYFSKEYFLMIVWMLKAHKISKVMAN